MKGQQLESGLLIPLKLVRYQLAYPPRGSQRLSHPLLPHLHPLLHLLLPLLRLLPLLHLLHLRSFRLLRPEY